MEISDAVLSSFHKWCHFKCLKINSKVVHFSYKTEWAHRYIVKGLQED